MAIREQAIQAGYDNNNGARHTDAFTDSVGHSGRLDELRLPIKTVGMMNLPALMGYMPVAFRAMRRGKMPPISHKNVENVEAVRRLFRLIEPEPAGPQVSNNSPFG